MADSGEPASSSGSSGATLAEVTARLLAQLGAREIDHETFTRKVQEPANDAKPESSQVEEAKKLQMAEAGGDHVALSIKELRRQLSDGNIDYKNYCRRRDEADLAAMDDDDPLRRGFRKKTKEGNMDNVLKNSEVICKEKLEELYQLMIKPKVDDGSYDGPDGLLVYQKDIDDMKEAYQDLPDLVGRTAYKKSAVLESFLKNLSEKPIASLDEKATKAEDLRQKKMLQLSVKLEALFEEYRKCHKNFIDACNDIILWFLDAAKSMDERRKVGNKVAIETASAGIGATVTGIGTIISVALAPVTFGASLLAIGLGVGAGAVGVTAGGVGLKYQRSEKGYNTENVAEQKTRIDNLNALIKEVEQAIQNIRDHGKKMEKALSKEYGLEIMEEESPHSKDDALAPRWITAVGDDLGRDHLTAAHFGIKQVFKDTVSGATLAPKAAAFMDDVITITKTGMTVADDVVDLAKAGIAASRAFSAVAIALGGVSLGIDIYTLVKATKDMNAGSKSETAIMFRDKAREVERVVRYFEDGSKSTERQVNRAEKLMRPILKRRSLLLSQ